MRGSGVSWAICKSAPRPRQITMPAPHHSVFTGWMPFLPPSQQCQSTEGSHEASYSHYVKTDIIHKTGNTYILLWIAWLLGRVAGSIGSWLVPDPCQLLAVFDYQISAGSPLLVAYSVLQMHELVGLCRVTILNGAIDDSHLVHCITISSDWWHIVGYRVRISYKK